jgi:hypothetical protein
LRKELGCLGKRKVKISEVIENRYHDALQAYRNFLDSIGAIMPLPRREIYANK